jgi:diadenosine tetraphosphate (Ap4A) HIT family hydrolase
MPEKKCEICELVQDATAKEIFSSDHWRVILSVFDQSYPGRSLVCLKRHTGSLAELTDEETIDWLKVVRVYESTAKKKLGATLFNWNCLMNNAFQQKPYNPHIHWHVRPRYNHPFSIAGETFTDPTFGNPIDRSLKRQVPPEVLAELASLLKS